MRVGVVLMCDKGKQGCTPLINTLISFGHTPVILYWDDISSIKSSGISHWIFSGNATYKKEDMTRMPMSVFSLPIHVFCICYSFQSALVQLGYALQYKKEPVFKTVSIFYKTPLRVKLKYSQHIKSPVKGELASYRQECMMFRYKNAILTQFHPELTADGRTLLKDFLTPTVDG